MFFDENLSKAHLTIIHEFPYEPWGKLLLQVELYNETLMQEKNTIKVKGQKEFSYRQQIHNLFQTSLQLLLAPSHARVQGRNFHTFEASRSLSDKSTVEKC